ncbi:DUF1190 domain-containing protein [Desulfovibrio sp. OttesenSCG-928-I05]|nr:DUF1190 domain-containing protein [Desulfovibrio sp. OttesenSCG-928-I05]
MKKASRNLSLVLMGSISLGVTGCSSEPKFEEEFMTFGSVSECVQYGGFTANECTEMATEAVKQTPTFTSQAECEAQFGEGNCQQPEIAEASSSEYRQGSSWMPLMAGYMMGRYLSGGQAMYGAQPLYKGPAQQGGTFRTAGGATVTPDAKGRVANPGSTIRQGFAHSAKPAAVRAPSASRGGFSGGKSFGGSLGS